MKILCFDLETTGLNFRDDEILQFSAVDNEGNEYNYYYRPEFVGYWDESIQVHGIAPEMVEDKDSFNEYENIKNIQRLIDEADLLVGYNILFDLSFLSQAGIQCYDKTRYDVMKEFAEIYGEWSSSFGEYRAQKLVTCADYYEYDWGEDSPHDALADAKATLYCYYRILEDNEVKV